MTTVIYDPVGLSPDWPDVAAVVLIGRERTAGGASICMGHGERLGRMEPGALGDLVLLPLDTPALVPLHDPVRQLVYGSPSADVRTVVVDGRVVVRDGELVGLDAARVNEQSRRYVVDAMAGERPADAAEIEAMVAEMYGRIEAQNLDVDAYLRP